MIHYRLSARLYERVLPSRLASQFLSLTYKTEVTQIPSAYFIWIVECVLKFLANINACNYRVMENSKGCLASKNRV
jgi:hypothetical protein